MTPLKQGIAYLINAARPGPTPPLVGTGQPGSNADMRARLTGLFGAPLVAMLSAPGIALAVHVPAPDPSQGDGGVSSFYTWLGEGPDTPGQMLRTEPLDPASGLEMAGEQDHDVPPAEQLALVRNACAQGSVVEAHLHGGLSHSKTVNASLKDSVPFVCKALAGGSD